MLCTPESLPWCCYRGLTPRRALRIQKRDARSVNFSGAPLKFRTIDTVDAPASGNLSGNPGLWKKPAPSPFSGQEIPQKIAGNQLTS